MERDFLGINGKDSRPLAKEDGRGSRHDAAVYEGSGVHWPFSNKISSMQQFMSLKQAQEERPKKFFFDQFSSSGFQSMSTVDACEANRKSTPTLPPQKCFSLDRQGAQFAMHAYQPHGNQSFGAPVHNLNDGRIFPVVSHHSVPIATSSPFFNVHGSLSGPNLAATSSKQQPLGGGLAPSTPVMNSVVGAFAPRNESKPSATSAQLTIFYAGAVNVYDDIPLDKAQAIMLLASKGSKSNPSVNAQNSKPEAPIPTPIKVDESDGLSRDQTVKPVFNNVAAVASPCSALSSPLSLTSQTGTHSANVSCTSDDTAGARTSGPAVPTSQNEPSKTITAALGSTVATTVTPGAVPQARKASLARFLEKRKGRVTNAMPYSCEKKASEIGSGIEGVNFSSKSSSADITLSSNCEESWRLGQRKNSAESVDSPSTKLEM